MYVCRRARSKRRVQGVGKSGRACPERRRPNPAESFGVAKLWVASSGATPGAGSNDSQGAQPREALSLVSIFSKPEGGRTAGFAA